MMQKHKFLILSAMIAGVMALSGCQLGSKHLSQETNQTLEEKIKRGKTTKAEIELAFGKPSQVVSNKGVETWVYTNITFDGRTFIPIVGIFVRNDKSRELFVEFNKSGVVKDFTYAQGTF